MVASSSSAADVLNTALVKIGWSNLVGTLYDGSKAATLALQVYGQTRDELLRSSDWGFAQRTVALDVLKVAPANYVPPNQWNDTFPPVPWMYEYRYPEDCLQVRAIRPRPLFTGPNFDPSPTLFQINNNPAAEPPTRTILTNLQDALCVYTGRITDPSTWSVDFTGVLADNLGKALAPALTGLGPAQMQEAEGERDQAKAEREQG